MNVSLWRSIVCVCCGTLVATVLGCGGSGPTGTPVSLSGTVSIDGRPLSHGVVEFQAIENEALNRTAVVTDGQFALDETHGLISGEYSVRVLPYEPEVEELNQISTEKRRDINAARKIIPARYQQAGELKADLSSDNPNQLKFDLHS